MDLARLAGTSGWFDTCWHPPVMAKGWMSGLTVLAAMAGLTFDQVASAGDNYGIAIGEIAPLPPNAGVLASMLRDVAEGEARLINPATMPSRRVIVSLAVTRSSVNPVACTVNAAVRDAKTGNMLVIIEGLARTEGPVSSTARREVAAAAVRRAVGRIPDALAAR